MTINNSENVDILLIGAGPSNIALAVALDERRGLQDVESIVMLEAANSISWHRGMMFPEAQSQVSFLKDLVTLRNPTSKFSFLNYLHNLNRLVDFVDLQTFFPYRREISDYLQWCVDSLEIVEVNYSSAVVAITPYQNSSGCIMYWTVSCANGRSYSAKKIVYGAGRDANLPEPYCEIDSANLLHASRFLERAETIKPEDIRSIAVIGGAQSSAEVYQECIRRYPAAQVRLLMRSFGFVPYGGSKFTNKVYSNEFVDSFYNATEESRENLLASMHDSNYAGLTPTMLESLFRFHYLQRMNNGKRAKIYTTTKLLDIKLNGDRICMTWSAGMDQEVHEEEFDMVVLGTGYKNEVPAIFYPTLKALGKESFEVTRNYRANIDCAPAVSLHLLGVNEATHGISDTLLSVVGARAECVIEDIERDTLLSPMKSYYRI